MKVEKDLLGARVVGVSKYQSKDGNFSAYSIEFDRGTLEIDTPILNICDANDMRVDILELSGYGIDYIGSSPHGEYDYHILFENGLRIMAEYYLDINSCGATYTMNPNKRTNLAFLYH